MKKLKLFTFWEPVNGTPAYINITKRLIKLHLQDYFELVHLDLNSARTYSKNVDTFLSFANPKSIGNSTNLKSREIAIFTDFLRIDLLRNHGGVWLDIDTIVFPAMAKLAKLLTEYDFFCSESESVTLANGIMGGPESSDFLKCLSVQFESSLDLKQQGDTSGWGEFGFRLLEESLSVKHWDSLFIAPFGSFIQFFSGGEVSAFSSDSYYDISIPKNVWAISLNNNSIGMELRSKSEFELMSSETIFSRAVKLSEGQITEMRDDYDLYNRSFSLQRERAKYWKILADRDIKNSKLRDRNQTVDRLREQNKNL